MTDTAQVQAPTIGQWLATTLPISARKQVNGKSRNVYIKDVPVYYPPLSALRILPADCTEQIVNVKHPHDDDSLLRRYSYSDKRLQYVWDAVAAAIDNRVRNAHKYDPTTDDLVCAREAARDWDSLLAAADRSNGWAASRGAFLAAWGQLLQALVDKGAMRAEAVVTYQDLVKSDALKTTSQANKDTVSKLLALLDANIDDDARDAISQYVGKLHEYITYQPQTDILSIDFDL